MGLGMIVWGTFQVQRGMAGRASREGHLCGLAKRWIKAISLKVNMPHAIHLRAVRGENLVA